MSAEETTEKNNEQISVEAVSEDTGEPEAKQMKIDLAESQPNLENMQVDTNTGTTGETGGLQTNTDLVQLEHNLEVDKNNQSSETAEGCLQTRIDSPDLEPNLQVVTNNESTKQTTEECSEIKIDSAELEPNLEDMQVVTNNESTGETTEGCISQKTCSISIQFHNHAIANLYKTKFMNFLSSFSEFQVQNESDLTVHVYRDENFEQNVKNQTPLIKKQKKHSKAKKELFVLDATPSEIAHHTDVRYTTKFVISAEKGTEEEDVCSSSRNGCFNCGDPHSLKDCLVPKDYARIAMARQKFKFQSKSTRYHSEEQQFGHLEPGKISNELRKALGLQKNEAPHFIYLMRRLGYPPGWLEEAKFVHSNLDLFDIDGKNVKSINTQKRGLDESKVVDYPGFNVPFQKGVKDDYRMYRVPPYSEDFNKKAMIRFFEKKFVQDHSEVCDVDLKHGLDVKSKLIMKSDVDRNSPSLVDLEQQKRQLLEELNEEPKDERKDSDYDSDKGFLAIKTSCFGTPLIKSSSPFSSLPNPDNFSKDVSPVINFENLPNSTGKYEQLTDVLQKVRDTLKKVNSS